jgi:Rab GDP dissociation inhibitor
LDKKETWKKYDLDTMTMAEVFKKWGISDQTQDFLGHAVALYTDDTYIDKNCKESIEKMQLYTESIGRYGDSPFLYPIYGLGGLPEAFSRLCAIHGGTYMLNTKVDEVTFSEDGKVTGIRVGNETASAPLVICDPSYTTSDKLTKQGKIIRAICLMNHPIPNTKDAPSIQIILPAK